MLFSMVVFVAAHEQASTPADFAIHLMAAALLVGVDSRRWIDVLKRAPHDFYHLPGYVALCARQEGGEPAALVVERNGAVLLLPLIIRPIPGGGKDATSPYGYPGPIVVGDHDQAFVSDAMCEGVTLLAQEGLVSLFVRFHPLLNRAPRAEVGTMVSHGNTIAIDLAQDDAGMWQETRRNHQRDIRKSLLAGHRVYEDHEFVHFSRFMELYQQTMLRAGAAPFYLFDDVYFHAMRDVLGSRLHLIVVEIEGEVAATSIEVETSGIVQDHLTGTDMRFSSLAPGKLLIHFVRSWARERGNRWLHLGGGVGGANDSLFQYKQGFSRRQLPFHTLRVVVDEGEYRRLVRAHNPAADPDSLEGYFPAYRQP
jgi:hypothetical protein